MAKQISRVRQRTIDDMALRNMFAKHPEDLYLRRCKLQRLSRTLTGQARLGRPAVDSPTPLY
jgi:hypothetical protein